MKAKRKTTAKLKAAAPDMPALRHALRNIADEHLYVLESGVETLDALAITAQIGRDGISVEHLARATLWIAQRLEKTLEGLEADIHKALDAAYPDAKATRAKYERKAAAMEARP